MNGVPNMRNPDRLRLTRLSRFTSGAGLLTKTVRLQDGKLVKRAGVNLATGTVEDVTLEDFNAFEMILAALRHDQALAYGIPLRGPGPVMSEKQWDASGSPADVLLRNRENFDWARGPGILMLDHDAPKDGPPFSQAELLDAIYRAVPPLQRVAHLWCASAGSCIVNDATKTEIVGIRGQRVYLWVDNAREIPRIGSLIEARLWLAGHGRIEVSRAGHLLERSLVDGAVWQPERLDFAAGAKCFLPLVQRRPSPVRLGGDVPLDTAAVPDLSEGERQAVERAKIKAKASKQDEAKSIREKCIAARAGLIEKEGRIGSDTALKVVRDAYERRQLMGDFLLRSQDGVQVSVREVIEDPQRWHGQRFHDPLDETCEDERIAYVNLLSGGRPYLWSHAHGGARYELRKALTTVNCSQGLMSLATEQTLDVMRSTITYYERANAVVTVGQECEVYPLGAYALKQRLESEIAFQKFDARQKEMKAIDCPDEVAKRVLDMRGDRGFPKLLAVVQYPTMTPDGRMLDRPGYDAETELMLVNPTERPWPRVPARPGNKEAVQALGRLWAPFALFPYVDAVSRGILLAALLTAVVRRALPTAPAFMFQAPAAGSGKTLLASCIVELAGATPLMSLPQREEEVQKVLVSHLRRAPGSLFFDNVVGVVDSKALNAMLTTSVYEGRILGLSETSGALPTNILVVLTGNNARPAGDTCRRMLVATIDARMENPYGRKFDFDPLDLVRANRLSMVIDALTILRAAIVSEDRPTPNNGLGSFEAWDRLVRQGVLWVDAVDRSINGSSAIGFGDPIANIQAQYSEDDDTEGLGNLLEVMFGLQDGNGFTARDLFQALDGARHTLAESRHVMLGQALFDVMPKAASPRGVSSWLKNAKGRVVRGLRLDGRHHSGDNNTRWYVQRI